MPQTTSLACTRSAYCTDSETSCLNTTFTIGNASDTTVPTITSVSPPDGTTNLGPNAKVVLTFSKSLNGATVTYTSVTLLAGDATLTSDPLSRSVRT